MENRNRIVREFLGKNKGRIIFLLLLAVTIVLLNIFIIEIGRRIINELSITGIDPHKKINTLMLYCFCILAAALAVGLINILLVSSYARFSQSLLMEIRQKLFKHLLSLPQTFYNANLIGQITSRIMNEVGYIGNFFSRLFLQPVIQIVMILFFGIYIFQLNWKLALAGTIFIPFSIIIIPKFNRTIKELTEASINNTGSLTGYLQEVFTGIGDIRSNQTYFFEESRLKKRLNDLFAINVNTEKTTGSLESVLKVITYLGPLSIYLYGGILCVHGEIPLGTLVAAIAVLNNLYNPVNSLVGFILESRQVKVRFEKIDEYLRCEPEKAIYPEKKQKMVSEGSIHFDKVKFGFSQEEVLLNDINFFAEYGKKTAFVGTSGSGKSITTALLTCIYNPSEGAITIGEDNIASLRLYDLRSRFGSVTQTPFMFNDSIKNNIMYALLRKDGGDIDRIEKWVDFSLSADVKNLEMLDRQVVNIVKEVGLFEDIFVLGLRSKAPGAGHMMTEAEKSIIVAARKSFAREVSERNAHYIEFYDQNKFLEYATIFENIVFGPANAFTQGFGSLQRFCRLHLGEVLSETKLAEDLFDLGFFLARTDGRFIEKLYKDKSPLMDSLNYDPADIATMVMLNEKLTARADAFRQLGKKDPKLLEDILLLALNHVPGRSKAGLLTKEMRTAILELRVSFRHRLPEGLAAKAVFFNADDYIEWLSLSENILFGNVDPLRKKANEDINILLKKIVNEAGLEELVVRAGLEFNVGERGGKLSGGQRQKVALARILLKSPSILILDEATAALDSASQTRITRLIRDKYGSKTVFSIAHRLNTVRDYDQILVFDRGQIVQRGTFGELMEQEGLFKKLYEGSN